MMERRCTKSPDLAGLGEGTAQSAGYEYTVGILRNEFFAPCFRPDSGRILCFAQEFGTLRGPEVMRSLIFENAGYHYDRKNHEQWRTLTRDAFYVRTTDWKQRVLRRGRDVCEKLVARSVVQSAL